MEHIQHDLFSFDCNDIQLGLSIVHGIHGLGISGASGLLAVLFPSHFGTVDQFLVKSLLRIPYLPEHDLIEKMNHEGLTLKDGVLLIKIMRDKADELNMKFNTTYWTPRCIDKILWCIER